MLEVNGCQEALQERVLEVGGGAYGERWRTVAATGARLDGGLDSGGRELAQQLGRPARWRRGGGRRGSWEEKEHSGDDTSMPGR